MNNKRSFGLVIFIKLIIRNLSRKLLFTDFDIDKNIIVISTYHRHLFKIAEVFYKINRLEFLLSGIPSFRVKEVRINSKENYIWINKFGFISIFIRKIIDKYGFTRLKAFLTDSNSTLCDFYASIFIIKLRLKDFFLGRNKKRILIISGHTGYMAILISKKFKWTVICDMPISNSRKISQRLEREFYKEGLEKLVLKNSKSFLREEKAIKFSDYLVVPNQSCKNSFICLKNQSKIFIAPYALPNWEKIQEEILFKEKKQSFKIITIGRLGIRKGTHILLDIYKDVEGIIDEWNLIGQESVEIANKLRDLKDLKKLKIHGSKSHSDIKTFLRKSTILVLPSLGEGMPLSIAEALHYKCTIICSKYCGILKGENPNIYVIEKVESNLFVEKIYEIFNSWKKNEILDNFQSNFQPYQLENQYQTNWKNILFEITKDQN
tara:strand:- start:1275 stop:2579 length:1305 start_codon:yes stop_codon:yes gene_type:complete